MQKNDTNVCLQSKLPSMFRLRDKNFCWFLGVLTFLSGICIAVLSILLLKQSVTLMMQQDSQKHTAPAKYNRKSLENTNWMKFMKSAVPLVVAAVLGVLVGALQSVVSMFSLIMDNSKVFQVRTLGWLFWMAGGVCNFILSTVSFALAGILKVHEKRDPGNSIHFWDNYRSGSNVVHNLEGHAFCSALACNSLLILICIAVGASKIRERPHLLLAL